MTSLAGFEAELTAALATSDAADGGVEGRLDALRVFTREKQRAIRERDAAGSLPLLALFDELSSLAEAVLAGSLRTAWNALFGDGPFPRGDFAVVAMGKLGGRELTYHSDLDIIYLYEDPEDQDAYTRLGTRIISALSVLTRQGIAYQIDTALRPSGNRGALMSSLASFREYHQTQGRTWERQALLRARPLVGRPDADGAFLKDVAETIQAIAYSKNDDARTIAEEINHLRGRMEREIAQENLPGRTRRYNLKTGRGGLVDIEFAVQYLQLVHGKNNLKLRNTNTILALRALVEEGIVPGPLAEAMEGAYLFLRGVETRLRLFLERPADDLIEGSEAVRELEARHYGKDFMPRLIAVREEIRSAYERIVTP